MLTLALVRQYAVGQNIDVAVADQEIVLHYALALLNSERLIARPSVDRGPGALLFKGGTALRKCVFGSTGRFSQDVDLDATHRNGFEAQIEAAFAAHNPYHGIRFSVPNFRYSQDDTQLIPVVHFVTEATRPRRKGPKRPERAPSLQYSGPTGHETGWFAGYSGVPPAGLEPAISCVKGRRPNR
jgi:hypothetical protein